MNNFSNTPYLGELSRCLLIAVCILLSPLIAPIYLLLSLFGILSQVVENTQSIDPKRRVVVITGCDSGFGFESAIDLAQQGITVIAACLQSTSFSKLEQALNEKEISKSEKDVFGKIYTFPCNVVKEEDRIALFEKVKAVLSEDSSQPPKLLHAVINNAGVGSGGNIEEIDEEEWQRVFGVTVFAVALLSRQFLPLLRQSVSSEFSDNVKPRIVNLSSQAGFAPIMKGCSGFLFFFLFDIYL